MRTTSKLTVAGGCLIALGGIASSWAVDPDSRDAMDEQVADAHRETQILNRFRTNPQLNAYDLGTIVDGNGARLTGTVDSEVVKALAERVAFGSEGILRVDNRIEVDVNSPPPPTAEARRSSSQLLLADAALSLSIQSKLSWNTHTESLDAHVDSRAGQVTLSGSTISYAERDMAETIARNTDGVIGIDNKLVLTLQPRVATTLDRDGESGGKTSDSWITSKVKTSLLFTRGFSHVNFAVTTRSGVVSLAGVVHSKADRDLAMQVAQDIRGVKQVEADGLTVG